MSSTLAIIITIAAVIGMVAILILDGTVRSTSSRGRPVTGNTAERAGQRRAKFRKHSRWYRSSR